MVKSMEPPKDEEHHSSSVIEIDDASDDISSDFVVLSTNSSTKEENGTESLLVKEYSITSMSEPETLGSDIFASAEMQNKVKQLLEENALMKAKLEENNDEMRKQLKMLAAWKENVDHVNSEQKKIIAESQDRILKLRAEKNGLAEKVSELTKELSQTREQGKQVEAVQAELEEMKTKISTLEESKKQLEEKLSKESIMKLQLEQDFNNLKAEMEEFQKNYEKLEEDHKNELAINQELQSQITDYFDEENKKFKAIEETYVIAELPVQKISSERQAASQKLQESLQASNRELTEELQKAKDEITSLKESLSQQQQKVSLLEKELDRKEKGIHSLKQQLDNLNATQFNSLTPDAMISLEREWESLKESLKTSQLKSELILGCLQTYKDKCDVVDAYLVAYVDDLKNMKPVSQEFILNLREKILELQAVLQREQSMKEEDKTNLTVAYKSIKELSASCKQLYEEWRAFQHEQKNKDQYLEAQKEHDSRKNQESIDYLTAKLLTLQEELQSKDDEINRLKKELEKLPILRSQVEMYHSTCQKEKEKRIASEREAGQLKSSMERQPSTSSQGVYFPSCIGSAPTSTTLYDPLPERLVAGGRKNIVLLTSESAFGRPPFQKTVPPTPLAKRVPTYPHDEETDGHLQSTAEQSYLSSLAAASSTSAGSLSSRNRKVHHRHQKEHSIVKRKHRSKSTSARNASLSLLSYKPV